MYLTVCTLIPTFPTVEYSADIISQIFRLVTTFLKLCIDSFYDNVIRKFCGFIVSQQKKYCKSKTALKCLLYFEVLFGYFWLFAVEFQAFVHYAIFSANYHKIPKVICEFRRKCFFQKYFLPARSNNTIILIILFIEREHFLSSSSARLFSFPQKPRITIFVVDKCALPPVRDIFYYFNRIFFVEKSRH